MGASIVWLLRSKALVYHPSPWDSLHLDNYEIALENGNNAAILCFFNDFQPFGCVKNFMLLEFYIIWWIDQAAKVYFIVNWHSQTGFIFNNQGITIFVYSIATSNSICLIKGKWLKNILIA